MTPIPGQENCRKCGASLAGSEILARYQDMGLTGDIEIDVECPECKWINGIALRRLGMD